MAADFQNQFQEAMREAEMADLKKQVDDMAHDVKNYDPLKDVRADVEAAGKDIETSLEQNRAVTTAEALHAGAAAGRRPTNRGVRRRTRRNGRCRRGYRPVAPEAIAT